MATPASGPATDSSLREYNGALASLNSELLLGKTSLVTACILSVVTVVWGQLTLWPTLIAHGITAGLCAKEEWGKYSLIRRIVQDENPSENQKQMLQSLHLPIGLIASLRGTTQDFPGLKKGKNCGKPEEEKKGIVSGQQRGSSSTNNTDAVKSPLTQATDVPAAQQPVPRENGSGSEEVGYQQLLQLILNISSFFKEKLTRIIDDCRELGEKFESGEERHQALRFCIAEFSAKMRSHWTVQLITTGCLVFPFPWLGLACAIATAVQYTFFSLVLKRVADDLPAILTKDQDFFPRYRYYQSLQPPEAGEHTEQASRKETKGVDKKQPMDGSMQVPERKEKKDSGLSGTDPKQPVDGWPEIMSGPGNEDFVLP
ncbi:MAG: hypothetical protein AAGF04_05575 [Chlamydiota bacterium]